MCVWAYGACIEVCHYVWSTYSTYVGVDVFFQVVPPIARQGEQNYPMNKPLGSMGP